MGDSSPARHTPSLTAGRAVRLHETDATGQRRCGRGPDALANAREVQRGNRGDQAERKLVTASRDAAGRPPARAILREWSHSAALETPTTHRVVCLLLYVFYWRVVVYFI